jgi:hypothetical protein
MFWPIYVYCLISAIITGSSVLRSGWLTGVDACFVSGLSLVAGAGLKVSLWWGDRRQKIGGPVFAALLVAVAQWIAGGFSANLFGQRVSGWQWGWIGFAIGFVFTNKKLYLGDDRQGPRVIPPPSP